MAKKKVIVSNDQDMNHGGTVFSLCVQGSERYSDFAPCGWVNNGDNTFTKGEFVLQPSYSHNGIEYHVSNAKGETEEFDSLREIYRIF